MKAQLQKHEWGFYEVIEKPSFDELQKYYAEKYYQENKEHIKFPILKKRDATSTSS